MSEDIRLLMRDLSHYMREHDQQLQCGLDQTSPEQARSFTLLSAELHACARLVATCTSIVNAAAQNVPLIGLHSILGFYPPLPDWPGSRGTPDLQKHLDAELVVRMNNFTKQLTFACTLTSQHLEYSDKSSHRERSNILLLCDAWQSLCDQCVMLFGTYDVALKKIALAQPVAGRDRLIRCLMEASEGKWPSVLDDGSIEVLDWAERRRSKRFVSDLPVTLYTHDNYYHVTARDISRGGMQVDSVSYLVRGEQVTVEAPNCRRLISTVVWINGTQAGLRFNIQLSENDPLLVDQALTRWHPHEI